MSPDNERQGAADRGLAHVQDLDLLVAIERGTFARVHVHNPLGHNDCGDLVELGLQHQYRSPFGLLPEWRSSRFY